MTEDIPTTAGALMLSPAKPLLRGRLHQWTLLVAVPAAVLLVAKAPPGSTRLAIAIYATTLIGLFATSAAYHRLPWSPTALRRMRTLDHSMIFLFIAGSNTAYAALILDGLWRWLLLVIVWSGALVGITLKFIKIDGFSRVGGTLYMGLGWIGVATLPEALQNSQGAPVALVALGGLMYTIGAIVLLRRRPDPSPRVFGYHEIWHALVVGASACQFMAIAMLVRTV